MAQRLMRASVSDDVSFEGEAELISWKSHEGPRRTTETKVA